MAGAQADESARLRHEAKRRKVRKGTHSCWECKHRKMKCIFDPQDTAKCKSCRKRGVACVGQEFPEETARAGGKGLSSPNRADSSAAGASTAASSDAPRPGSYAAFFDRTAEAVSGLDGRRPELGMPTPVSTSSEPSRRLDFYTSEQTRINSRLQEAAAACPRKYARLSRVLCQALPCRDDISKICRALSQPSVLADDLLTVPYATLDLRGLKRPETFLRLPELDWHPVLIARYMLHLSTFLLRLRPDMHRDIDGLTEPPLAMTDRMVDLVISLVTTNDDLLGSIEGLECVMVEGVYQANIGNLRRSWLAVRRAMGIAQLMGLQGGGASAASSSSRQQQYTVLDPQETGMRNTELMWLRIVTLDRHLCLMLGLPQGSRDVRMADPERLAADTPMGRLERLDCVVACRILERNETCPSADDYATTRAIDAQLQRAARSLPSKWWLAPVLENPVRVNGSSSNSAEWAEDNTVAEALFWDTRRLFAQLAHYNLLNQLHLPYMLRASYSSSPSASSSVHGAATSTPATPGAAADHHYSRITCVNASRELLTRFLRLRSFSCVAYNCRTIVFTALMAAMTLLLAHLDSRHRAAAPYGENLLAHQYLSDRAMIEQVQENMEEVNRLNSDALSAQSADLLRRLLAIEMDTTVDGCLQGTDRVSVRQAGEDGEDDEDDGDGSGDGNDAAGPGPSPGGDGIDSTPSVVSVRIPYFGTIKIAKEGMRKERDEAQGPGNVPTPLETTTPATTTATAVAPSVPRPGAPSDPPAAALNGHLNVSMPTATETAPPLPCQAVPGMVSMMGTGSLDTLGLDASDMGADTVGSSIAPSQYAPQLLQSTSTDPYLHYGQYPGPCHGKNPGLVAGGEDWAFQGVDMAFFESLMRTT